VFPFLSGLRNKNLRVERKLVVTLQIFILEPSDRNLMADADTSTSIEVKDCIPGIQTRRK